MGQRGRPRIKECWTRVISLQQDNLDQPRLHVVATDLLLASNYPYQDVGSSTEAWAPLFFSKDYIAEHDEITPENFELESEELKRLGILVSQLRARIRDDAEAEVKMEFDLGELAKVDFDKAI